ncbi:MAG TPA: hypothetical protein VF627_07470 [Abditibacterium sp.]|jgi:hypothetical protein
MKLFSLLALVVSSATVLAQPQQSSIAPRFPPPVAPPVLDAPIAWKPVRGADGKPIKPQIFGEFKVELMAGAWCRPKQFDSPRQRSFPTQNWFDSSGFAGFAIQPRLTGRDGKVIKNPDFWSGTFSGKNGIVGYGAWRGDENGGIYFPGLNPYAKRGILKLDFPDPKRPPEADGSVQNLLRFEDLAYPAQVNTYLPVNKTFETPRGSKITLLGYGRYEPGLPTSADGKRLAPAGIYLFLRSVKASFPKGVRISQGNMKVGARNGNISAVDADDLDAIVGYYGDLHEGKGLSSDVENENMTHVFAVPDKPRPLHLQLQINEYHPSWRQAQFFPTFSFPIDVSRFPMPTRDAKFAPLATAKNADVEVALDLWQDRSDELNKPSYLAWFWTRDLKIKDDPSLRWIISGGATRPEWYLGNEIKTSKLSDGGTVYRAAPLGWNGGTWRFRPDGSPILGSEYRPALTFSADELQGQPQKWDMSVEFAQWRLKKHIWSWKAVPVPPMGQKIAVNRVAISPTGMKIKLLNVASYDAAHQFAGIESGFGVTLENKAQGVAFTFETELAQFPKPKAFDNKELQANVVPSPGSAWDLSSGGDHDQISGQKSTPQILRWTKIYPLRKLEANSFDLDLSWEADYPTGRTATFDFRSLPAPLKDSR